MNGKNHTFTRLSSEKIEEYRVRARHDQAYSDMLKYAYTLADKVEMGIRGWNNKICELVMESALGAGTSLIEPDDLDEVIEILKEVWEHGKKLSEWYRRGGNAEKLKAAVRHHKFNRSHKDRKLQAVG